MEQQVKTLPSKAKYQSSVKLPLNVRGSIQLAAVDNPEVMIVDDEKFMEGFGRYILATRPNGSWNTEFEPKLLKDLLEEHQVTVREAVTAFKKAYSDHFTPASGIEWRHLWKYIEEMRLGRERRLYTYQEMLNIVATEHISTDHFERVGDDQWKRR